MRYYLSPFNAKVKDFPIGTFTANIIGTILISISYVLRRVPPESPAACAALIGLSDGFCGCLTTVSTFVMEVVVLKPRVSVRYVIISIGVAQVMLLAVVGGMWWGRRFEAAVCAV